MAATNVSVLSYDLPGFKESFKEFGFSFDEIHGLMKMFDPDSSGICGSLVFRHLARMFGKDVSKWAPSDIDFCVTKQKDYDFVKKHFSDQGFLVRNSFTPSSRYSNSMADVMFVCEIYPNKIPASQKPLQVILVRPDDGGGVVSHLKQVDLDVTRVAYTTRGFIGVGNALESIAAGESSFPARFRNIRCLNKTFFRSVKYSEGRGVKINYPKYITYTPQTGGIFSICVANIYARFSHGKLILKSARAEDEKKRTEALASERVKQLTEQVELQRKKIEDLEADDSDDDNDEDYDKLQQDIGGYKTKLAMILNIVNPEADEKIRKLEDELESLKSTHEWDIASLNSAHEKALASLKTLQKDLERKHEAGLSDVSAKLTVAVDDLAQLQKRVVSQKEQLDTEMDRSKVLQQENRDLTVRVKSLEDRLKVEIDNSVKLQKDYHEASKKLTASTTKLEGLRASILEHVSE